MAKALVLKIINNNGIEVTDSRDVAKMIGKTHSNLMRDIRSYIDNMKEDPNSIMNSANSEKSKVNSQNLKINIDEYFIESTYQGARRKEKCYLVTKKGCEFIGNKLNSKKGVEFTAQYVNAFNEMEETIKKVKELKKPRQKKVVKERITDYTITGMRKTLENSSYIEMQKNIDEIIEYHRNLSINFRDKAYQKEEFKDKTKYVNVIKSKIVKILEDIRKLNKGYAFNAVISEIIENLLKELKTSNNISNSIKMNNLKKEIEKKDNKILLLNPPMSKFLDLETYGFSFNKMYHYYKNEIKRTKVYNEWAFNFPYDKVAESFKDVDLTRPSVMFAKYIAPESNDIDNFVKSTQDAVASSLGCNDNKIHKINAERIGYCDRLEQGKILVYIRNLTEEEINENKLIK